MGVRERMIAIAVGIAGSVPQRYLSGALTGARHLEVWAKRQGYETTLITDEKENVTIPVLRQRVEYILRASPAPIHRIIVYFAGHGLIREMEESLWLLSDWRSELRAVAVEGFKRRLFMWGPRQVCIISDACKSLPADVEQNDLVPDAVLGSGPRPVDPMVAVDRFDATQDGAESFMIPGPNPNEDRCLFSGVLAEGLWGIVGAASNKDPYSTLVPGAVTSSSLGAYLLAEVPVRARQYGLKLTPRVLPTFPDDDNFYFRKDPAFVPPMFPPWPAEDALGLAIARAAGGALVAEVIIGGRGGDGAVQGLPGEGGRSRPAAAQPAAAVSPLSVGHYSFGRLPEVFVRTIAAGAPSPGRIGRKLRRQLPPAGSGVSSGISIAGKSLKSPAVIWGPGTIYLEEIRGIGAWSVREAEGSLTRAAPILIQFADGRFGSTVVLPNLFASLVRDGYGMIGMDYCNLSDPRTQNNVGTPAEQALRGLERGTLRVGAAMDLAAKLRLWKHVDPVLGVISAYLYDAIGDVDSIRRIAGFYAQECQNIPYDVALLGGLSGTRNEWGFEVHVPALRARPPRTQTEERFEWTYCAMDARDGKVGGLWPWMRQGWTLLDDPGDFSSPLVLPGILELRRGLMRSRFTTFEADQGQSLVEMFNLRPRWSQQEKSRSKRS